MKKLTILTIVILVTFGAFSQDITQRLDSAITSSISKDGPGVTVLIRHNGKIIYEKGFGMANVEQGVKMDPGHVFRIGSITKQFTACAILKLQEEGKLSVQDDMHKYLPDYPTQGQKITIEHLLTHTSGIKSYTSLPEWTPAIHRNDYEPLVEVRDKKDQVYIYMKPEGEIIENIIILVREPEEFVFLDLKTRMTMQDLERIEFSQL